ncbi:MAG TPA: hypothetical protein VHG71_09270 [Verrucomicrobiae bacterium]|nr:hypothetical protein [Verrucomicrobiae bacterium]
MELKVLCDCGQKFKFDAEPVNGRMPFTVNCPVCNADGTEKANLLIAENLAAATPTIVTSPSGGLRISRTAQTIPPPSPSTTDDSPPPTISPKRPLATTVSPSQPKKTSFGMGLLGGFIGALVGSIIYFFIYKFTGLHLKLLALGVGGLAGWFAELMGKGEGSKELGGVTVVLVLAGVIGAQYFVALGLWHKVLDERLKYAQSAYANAVVEAKETVKMIPTGSDMEIRQFLAKQSDESGVKINPADFDENDVKEFRENQLPEYRELANGQITKEQYESTHEIKTTETQADKDTEEDTFKSIFLLLLMSKTNIFSLVAAAALAFKLSTNA